MTNQLAGDIAKFFRIALKFLDAVLFALKYHTIVANVIYELLGYVLNFNATSKFDTFVIK